MKYRTIEELNKAAEALMKAGDEDALVALALEHGLDKEDAEDYMNGCTDALTSPFMAAVGKLKLEAEELQLKSQLADWKDYIVQLLADKGDNVFCNAVFDPDKKLLDVLAAGLKTASKNRVTIDKRITKAAGLPGSAAQIGMCGKQELKQIIMDYYMGGAS